MDTNKKGIFFASTTAILWGFLPIGQKLMLQSLDPYTIVWSRFVVAFTILFIILYKRNKSQLNILRKPPLLLVVAAIALLVNYVSVLIGLHYTSPNTVQIVIQLAPIMFCVIGFVFFKEKLNSTQTVGFVLALVGLFLFYRSQLEQFSHQANKFNIGFLLVLLGAVGWVIYATAQKLLVKKYKPQTLNLFLYFLPIPLLIYWVDFSSIVNLTVGEWCLLLFLGLNTLVAYGALSEALKLTQASKVSVIITMNPIVTVIVMSLIALLECSFIEGELMNIQAGIGAGILLIAAFIISKFKN